MQFHFCIMQIKVIFIRMVLHLDSLSNRGTRELGNHLLCVRFFNYEYVTTAFFK